MLFIAIATPIITTEQFTLFQHASSTKTAIMLASPYTGTYQLNQPFTVDIIADGGGQSFNAARATVTISSNLTVQSISFPPATSGGCGFIFPNTNATPTITNPSFAGAILNGSSARCIVYTLTVVANTTGIGTITFTQESVKAYANSGEIFSSAQNGSYNLGIIPTATPTPTPTPNMPTPTPTPLPQATPTPTPTQSPVQAPTIDAIPTDTYQSTMTLSGTKSLDLVSIYINNATTNVTYPSTTTWQFPTTLVIGGNTFNVYGITSSGTKSNNTSITITLHRLGDINGDNVIDLTDLSMFGSDWDNTGTLNYSLSDMNGDGVVDLTDFSIIARTYGN